MAIRYVLVNDNNEAVVNEDGSLAIQTAEFVFATQDELDAHNAELLKVKAEQEKRISELVSISEKQAEELKQIDINNYINSLTNDEDIKTVLFKAKYDSKEDIAVIKAQIENNYQDLLKVKPVNTGGVIDNSNVKTDDDKNNDASYIEDEQKNKIYF
ncbi:hypothetical protein [Spiroplasma sp. SV19]|uniref:hypothetical protein n=1 Tax=Spiroplasma sp. SV19 TaxID=2570468 RepID=UPI0024B6761A|nr:hypothetical protein [Spiroplasma sp. SV19]WHQ37183.1 hypothetical protein E7Y35_04745 [Spiroplasma sp. SV19]